MIQANELRIGVYVHEKGKGAIQIQSGHDIEEIEDWLGDTDYYTGIPLTDELLTDRFKLKFDTDGFYHLTDDLLLKRSTISENLFAYAFDTYKTIVSFGKPINYVHQLQNLYFALTGKELV